jgi:hypothetical protein
VIQFNIPGTGVHTIAPNTPLPNVTRPLTINGASEPGYTTSPLIQVNGAAQAPPRTAFVFWRRPTAR